MSVVDDYGRYFSHPAILRAGCYPLKLDAVCEADVKQMLSECVASGVILLYGGGKYLQVVNFRQQTRGSSKYPEPTQDELLSKCKADDKQMRSESESESKSDAKAEAGQKQRILSDYSVNPPTLDDCIKAAEPIGMKLSEIKEFFNHFDAVGWIDPQKRTIRSLASALAKWKLNQPNFKPKVERRPEGALSCN